MSHRFIPLLALALGAASPALADRAVEDDPAAEVEQPETEREHGHRTPGIERSSLRHRPGVRVYTAEDLRRHGDVSVANALRRLDPSLR